MLNILRGRFFDENFLMTMATLGAIAIHLLPEAVAVMLFYKIGELVQDVAVNRSRRSIRSLLEIRPDAAALITKAGIVGIATLWEAVFADVGVVLLAILNATRVLR